MVCVWIFIKCMPFDFSNNNNKNNNKGEMNIFKKIIDDFEFKILLMCLRTSRNSLCWRPYMFSGCSMMSSSSKETASPPTAASSLPSSSPISLSSSEPELRMPMLLLLCLLLERVPALVLLPL